MKQRPKESYFVPSVQKCAAILDALAQERSLSLAELTKRLALPRTTVYALLLTLEDLRWIEPDEPNRYRLGPAIFEVGARFLHGLDLDEVARSTVRDLSLFCDETANAAILSGTDIIYIAKHETTNAIRTFAYVGLRLAAHASSMGKVLLAGLSPGEWRSRYLGKQLEQLTPATVTSLDQLAADIASVRRAGMAFDREESTVGLYCYAAPIRNQEGVTVAAISLSAPSLRVTAGREGELIRLVQEQAAIASRRMGFVESAVYGV